MLQLYNLDKVKIKGLKAYKDYYIDSELATGDKTLSILYPSRLCKDIKEEYYLRNKSDEFVIKEVNDTGSFTEIKATLNVEDLEGKPWEIFETINKTISESLTLALAGTGWTLGSCNVNKRRTIRKTNSSTWDIIQEAKKTYRCEVKFDTINKKINISDKFGLDKGVYFLESLNLKSIGVQGNTYNFYTRIIAKGKGDLKVKVDNFQYSNKIKEFIWVDERYTDEASLKEDAIAKLNDLSKPYKSYTTEVIDLANISEEYSILNYELGDTITLISKSKSIKEKQRIVRIREYPEEAIRNTCELANVTIRFEDIQKELLDAANTINNVTSDNGTLKGDAIDSITTDKIIDFEANVGKVVNLEVVNAKIEYLYAEKANIGELNAVIANIGELNATKANITELNAVIANIGELNATKADITELNAVSAKINVLEVDTASIKNLLAGNITSGNIQAGGITSDKLTIENGFITNAMIANLDVGKVNSGDISTNKFKIKSDDGGIEIVGATQQFKDKNNKVRIQMGQDTQGNFNFILRGEDGSSILIDHTGIKENAIPDNLIKENMLASDSVGEKQIDYNSFASGFNKDTNTNYIKSTHIKLNNANQSLEVAFNSLKTQADGTKTTTESNSTAINVMQGKITTAINNTQIVKDGQTILLKDDYNRTVITVNSMNSTIGQHASKIDAATGKITEVETKTNVLERNLDSMSSKLSATETKVNENITQISTNKNDIKTVNIEVATTKSKVSEIEQELDSVTIKVSDTEKKVTTVTTIANEAKETALSANNTANFNKADIKNHTIQISNVTSKTATLETNLNGITGRVTNAENNIATVDGKIISVDNRLKTAEQKITPDAIKNTVKGEFYTKGEVDGKGYATSAEVTHTANQVRYEFSSSGGYNLLKNSGFKTNNLNHWGLVLHNNPQGSYSLIDQNSEWGYKDYNVYTCQLKLSNQNGIEYGIRQNIKTTIGRRYTLSFKCAAHRIDAGRAIVRYPDGEWLANIAFTPNNKDGGADIRNWATISLSFTATHTSHDINIVANRALDDGYMWIVQPLITEGEMTLPYSPAPDEVYSGNTCIDAYGVIIYNGGLEIKNKAYKTVLKGDSNGNLEVHEGAFKIYGKDGGEIMSCGDTGRFLNVHGLNVYGVGNPFNVRGDGDKGMQIQADQNHKHTFLSFINGDHRPNSVQGYSQRIITSYQENYIKMSMGLKLFDDWTHTNKEIYFDQNGQFRPGGNGWWDIGRGDRRFNILYCNSVNQASDRNLKTDISYLQNSNVKNTTDAFSYEDCYDFVKNLDLATYKYNQYFEEKEQLENVGFIANDIKDSKIGKFLIKHSDVDKETKEKLKLSEDVNEVLSYNLSDYISVVAGANKVACVKIEQLEKDNNAKDKKILELENGIKAIEEKLGLN